MNYLKSIWPTIYRIINSILFFVISVIKGMVKIAVRQLKGGPDGT